MKISSNLALINFGIVCSLISGGVSSAWAARKKTVGDLFSQAGQDSRGAGSGGARSKKAVTALPKSQIHFEQKTKTNFDQVKPPRASDLLRTAPSSDQEKYERILDEQIQELYRLSQKSKNSPNRGELWVRLAELYVEKATLMDTRAQDEYDAKLKAFRENRLRVKPQLDQSNAREYNRKAIKLYEWFEKDFPRDPKMSQALFFLGYNYFELGENQKGAAYYARLNRDFPKSPFVGESHFALGEFYFETDKWRDAYQEYSYLMKLKGHRLHDMALYKAAWCLYRLGDAQKGLRFLETVIRRSRDQGGGQANKEADRSSRLEGEALRDIVIFYAAQGNPSDAARYFRELLDSDEVYPLVERLAYYYSDKGEREGARQLFKQLIVVKPAAPKAFEYQYQIVQNYFYSKNSPLFKEELYRWVKDFGAGSSWESANQENKTLIDNAYKLRESTLRNWVLQQHQTAQNSRAPHSQAQAAEGYDLYLHEFPQSPVGADMHFYYGELLYDLGKYDEASQQYRWIVDNGPKSKFYDKAGVNLILAAEKSIPTDKELQARVGTSIEARPLDPRVERFIKAAQWHLEKFPNSERNPEVKFRIGRLYYLHNQFDEANKSFKDIVKNHPRSKYSEYSANLMLDIFNLKKDYVGLEKAGSELLAVPSISSSKAGHEIRGVIEKANFKRGQDLEIEKKYSESGMQFESFAKQNPRSSLAVTAWFNAGVNYERSGQNGSAVRSYNQVLASYAPEAEALKPKARQLMAKLYQDGGQFEEAAKLYVQAAKESPNSPLAGNFKFNAAIMYQILGRNNEAIRLYQDYKENSKKNADRREAALAIADIYRRSENGRATINAFKEYLDLNPIDAQKAVEAHYWIWFYLKKARNPEADLWRDKTLGVQRRVSKSDRAIGSRYAAEIKLAEANEIFNRFRAITIPADPAKQKNAVNLKVDALAQLTRVLNEVAKYESPEEVVSSLAVLGEANLHMAQAIQNSPIPSGLNAQEKKQYEEGMGKFAEPFMGKATEVFRAAVERGFELEVYNDGFRRAREVMVSLDSKNYYDQGEVGFETRYLDWIQQ
jgi:TolA-binding protein